MQAAHWSSRDGVAAVLVPGQDPIDNTDQAVLAVTPGALVHGEIARLLDRGYQKFIKTSQYELPATARNCMPFISSLKN